MYQLANNDPRVCQRYRAACLSDDVCNIIILCRADGRVGVIGLRYGYLVWGGDATMQQRILMAAMAPWRGGGRSLLAVAFGSEEEEGESSCRFQRWSSVEKSSPPSRRRVQPLQRNWYHSRLKSERRTAMWMTQC